MLTKAQALEALGLSSGSNPSKEVINRACKKMAFRWHPDKLKYPDNYTQTQKDDLLKEWTKRIQKINEAKTFLLNPLPVRLPDFQNFHSNHFSGFPFNMPPPSSHREPEINQSLHITLKIRRPDELGSYRSELKTIVFSNIKMLNTKLEKLFSKRSIQGIKIIRPHLEANKARIEPSNDSIDVTEIKFDDPQYSQLDIKDWEDNARNQLIRLHQSVKDTLLRLICQHPYISYVSTSVQSSYKKKIKINALFPRLNAGLHEPLFPFQNQFVKPFFSPSEESTINDSIIHNRTQYEQTLKKELEYKKRWFYIQPALYLSLTLMFAGVASLPLVWPHSPWIITGLYLAVAAVCNSVYYYTQNRFSPVKISGKYSSPYSKYRLQKATPSEKQSLHEGLKANTWPGYFTSFTILSTSKHLKFFNAGMQVSMTENEYLKEKINRYMR